MSVKNILFFFLATLSLYSCQTSVEQKSEKLFGNFYVRYLQPERQLRAEATFSKGDSTIQTKGIQLPTVNFDGAAMDVRDLAATGFRYKIEKGGGFTAEHNFHFKDISANEMNLKMELSPINSFAVNEPASLSKGIRLSWEGVPLAADEQLVLLFSDANNKAALVQINGPTDTAALMVSPNKLKGIATGSNSLYLVKKKLETTTSPAFEATKLFEFYTNTIQVSIVE